MSFQENGLKIVISPPEGEKIAPNENSQTRVSITNQKHESGVRLAVFLDLKPELKQWCKNYKHKITIGYQQTQEIEFFWNIPPQAIPGDYDYILKIEFIRSTSFYTFTPRHRQLTILTTIVPPPTEPEPSFVITPISSSTQAITLATNETLNLEIYVHNRSHKTDNFRITTDLDSSWYTIRYPETIKKLGAIAGTNELNLNPGEQDKINLFIHPPADTIAGNYKPEIRLRSVNYPDLFLKKIVYLNIPPQYNLQVEFQTILNKVSHKPGQYKILLNNQGNTLRKLEIAVKTSDEDELCEYFLEKSLVRLTPNKITEIKLEVRPNSKQKRPFLATKQFNFQVDLIDKNDLPVPKNLPLKSSLFWRSRPLWQLILLSAVLLGLVVSCAWLVWELLKSEEPKITLKSETTEYEYGQNVGVNWSVENPKNLEKLIIFERDLGNNTINTKCYIFAEPINQQNCKLINQTNLPKKCQINNNKIRCQNIIFYHAKDVKTYIFQLEALTKQGKIIKQETEPIAILPRPTLTILDTLKATVTKSEAKNNIELSFAISDVNNFVGEDKIFLIINNKLQASPIVTPQNISEFCSATIGDRYLCNIDIPNLTDGKYSLGIELQSDSDGRLDKKIERFILPEPILISTPIKLNYFKINNSDSGTLQVEADVPITVSWSVTGKNAQVNLDCIGGELSLQGSKKLNVPENTTQYCTLEVLDREGKLQFRRILGVKVKERPQPVEAESTDKIQ